VAADLKLGGPDGDDGWLIAEGDVFKATASDVMIDNPARRKNTEPFRRAFVHDFEDGLTINFDGDYPGGVTINRAKLDGAMITKSRINESRLDDARLDDPTLNRPVLDDATINLRIIERDADAGLPAEGNPGDVLVLFETSPLPEYIPHTSLWVCVRTGGVDLNPGAWWARIPLDEAVQGTA
jgi:hypothetical protein